MRNIEIFDGNFTVEQINSNTNKLFVISDNTMKVGQNPFRDLPNVLVLRIKKGSSTKPAAYFSSGEYEVFKKTILQDILKIKINLIQDRNVVFTNSGYGNIEKVGVFGPKIKEHLDLMLKSNFNFDNTNGTKFVKVPSYDEIQNSNSIQLDDLTYNTLNSKQIINAILSQKKVAFSTESEISIGSVIKFISASSSDVLVCRVTNSYPSDYITATQWAILEICDESKYIPSRYQHLLELICSVNPSGVMNFNNDIFGVQKKVKEPPPKKENVKEPEPIIEQKKPVEEKIKQPMSEQNQNNQEIYELLNQINSKLDQLLSEKNTKYSFFKKIKNPIVRKTLNEILFDSGISGEVKDLGENNYEIISSDKIYFVKFKKGLLKNSIKIILTKDK